MSACREFEGAIGASPPACSPAPPACSPAAGSAPRAWLLHALFLLASASQSMIVPLLPRLSHSYGLSATADAAMLAAPGVATVAVSLPAGALADRFGARRVTVAATALICLATLAQAAPSYGLLIGGRLALGLGYGIAWTTGVAWMSQRTAARACGLGAVATSGATGLIAGPLVGGLLADWLGLGAPFAIIALLAGALALALSTQPASPPGPSKRTSLRPALRHAQRHAEIGSAALALAISGAVGGVTQLLLTQQLHRAGFSAGATGSAFSAAAVVYIATSAIVVRAGDRATTQRVIGISALWLAIALLPAAFAEQALVLVCVLAGATVPRAIISTISYPLAVSAGDQQAAAEEQTAGDGTVIGLLNCAWAAGLLVAPLIAGAVDQLAGVGAAYVATLAPIVIAALWLTTRAAKIPAPKR